MRTFTRITMDVYGIPFVYEYMLEISEDKEPLCLIRYYTRKFKLFLSSFELDYFKKLPSSYIDEYLNYTKNELVELNRKLGDVVLIATYALFEELNTYFQVMRTDNSQEQWEIRMTNVFEARDTLNRLTRRFKHMNTSKTLIG